MLRNCLLFLKLNDENVKFCSVRLVRAGGQPQIAMKLARHSTIYLTMKHYIHFSLQDKSEAMQKLSQNNSGATVNIKTGTDDYDTNMVDNSIVGDINNSKCDGCT